MDEATQQAVQLGVNVTIFVIALSVCLNLLLGVRNIADVAGEYNASIPSGSKLVAVEVNNERKRIKGNELISYYANYMTEKNGERTQRYVIKIQDGVREITSDDLSISQLNNNVDLSKEYELITERYDRVNDRLYITFKAVE